MHEVRFACKQQSVTATNWFCRSNCKREIPNTAYPCITPHTRHPPPQCVPPPPPAAPPELVARWRASAVNPSASSTSGGRIGRAWLQEQNHKHMQAHTQCCAIPHVPRDKERGEPKEIIKHFVLLHAHTPHTRFTLPPPMLARTHAHSRTREGTGTRCCRPSPSLCRACGEP